MQNRSIGHHRAILRLSLPVALVVGSVWLFSLVSVLTVDARSDSTAQRVVVIGRESPAADTYSYTAFLPFLWRSVTDPVYGPWGVQMYDQLDASRGFDFATAGGVRWIRLRVSWFEIESINTTPAFYNWSALDQTMLAAGFNGINLVVTLEGNPSWAAPTIYGPVNNLNDLKEFVGAVVERYPQVRYWELYNEPDNMYHFGGRGGTYATHLNAVYPVIKSANPSAQLVMGGIALDWFTTEGGGFDPNFVNDMLQACVAPCFDVANFHYYPLFRARWNAQGRDIIGKANAFRQMLAARGYIRPMLSTETGWVYQANPGGDWGGPDIQGRYVPKAMIRGQAANLIMTNWYALTDADPTLPGLLGGAQPFQIRPSYTAMKRLITQLKAAQFERALTSGEMGHPDLEGYRYSQTTVAGNTERIDVTWYDCPGLVVGTGSLPVDCLNAAAYDVPASQVTVYDHLNGSGVVYTDGNDGVLDGKVKLFINRNPVYIHYTP